MRHTLAARKSASGFQAQNHTGSRTARAMVQRQGPGNQAVQRLLRSPAEEMPSIEMVPGGKGVVKILVDGTPVVEIVSADQKGEHKALVQWDSVTRQLRIQVAVTPGVSVDLLPTLQELSKRFPISAEVVEVSSLQTLPLSSVGELGGISPGASISELRPRTIELPPIELAGPNRILPESEVLPAPLETLEPEPATPEEEATVEDIALTVADVATDFVPGVSNVKDATIALTGVNPVTGEEVGIGGRILSGIFAIPGLGNAVKYVAKGGKLLGKALLRIGKSIGKSVPRVVRWSTDQVQRLWSWVRERLGRMSTQTPPSGGKDSHYLGETPKVEPKKETQTETETGGGASQKKKFKSPDRPPGVKESTEMGKLMEWGKTTKDKVTGKQVHPDLSERIANLTKEELVSKGVTLEDAKHWRDVYRVHLANPTNVAAPKRLPLMERAVELLSH